MVIICWNRRVTRRSQACLTFSLFMERRWVKIKMRERKLICGPGRHWEILEDSGWINHDVCEPVLKRSRWWDSDHRLENQRLGGLLLEQIEFWLLGDGLHSFIGFKHSSERGYKDSFFGEIRRFIVKSNGLIFELLDRVFVGLSPADGFNSRFLCSKRT